VIGLPADEKHPAVCGDRPHSDEWHWRVGIVAMTTASRMETALDYASMGWAVFPVHSIVDGMCTCRDGERCSKPGKHPRTRNGVKAATTDEKRIRRWWTGHPTDNIGVATGSISGLVVVDVDPRHGGNESFAAAQERYGPIPPGPVAKTGGGGQHLVFAHPGRPVPCRVNLMGGIDIRADGGYIVAPPSDHLSGGTYRWARPPTDISPPKLPAEWLDLVMDGRSGPGVIETVETVETVEDGRGHCGGGGAQVDGLRCRDAAVENAILSTLPTEPGTRHRCLFEFCRALQAIPGVKGMPLSALKPWVKEWYERAKPNIVNADFVDNWEDFTESWDKVKYPKGEDIMVQVWERAKAAPDASAIKEYENEKMGILVAICRELQREAGDNPFFLSCALAAKLLDITSMRAWRWLKLLCREGRLELISKGNQKRANRYRYVGNV